MKKIFSEEKYQLMALFAAALALRLAYVLYSGQENLSPDSYSWMEISSSIADGKGFGGSWRPPGFAFFMGGIFLLAGKSVLAVQVSNCLLGSLTVLFTVFIAARLFGRATGLLSGALVCFYPYLLAYTRDPISETFLTFMLSAAILRIVIAAQQPSTRNYVLAGALIGLTGLTKSTTLPFFLLSCCWLWWQTGKFRAGLYTGLCVILTIAPWTLRNSIFYGKSYVMPVSTPWQSFYGANCDEAMWQEMAGSFDRPMDPKMTEPALPKDWLKLPSMPVPERDKLCKERSLAWIKANPDKFYYLLYRRFLHFWRLYPMMAYKWQKYAAMATSGLYIPLALLGFFLSYREFRKTSLFAALFASYTLVHIFFVTTMRYRVPIDPYLIILAAYAVVTCFEKLRAARAA